MRIAGVVIGSPFGGCVSTERPTRTAAQKLRELCPMDLRLARLQQMTRRHFVRESQVGLGAVALASLLARDAPADTGQDRAVDPLAPRKSHFAPRATRVIYL